MAEKEKELELRTVKFGERDGYHVAKGETKAEHFGLSPERLRGRQRAGQVPGTLSLNGRTIYTGSLNEPRPIILPNTLGTVWAIHIDGLVGVGAHSKLQNRHPYVWLHPLGTGYTNYMMWPILAKP